MYIYIYIEKFTHTQIHKCVNAHKYVYIYTRTYIFADSMWGSKFGSLRFRIRSEAKSEVRPGKNEVKLNESESKAEAKATRRVAIDEAHGSRRVLGVPPKGAPPGQHLEIIKFHYRFL